VRPRVCSICEEGEGQLVGLLRQTDLAVCGHCHCVGAGGCGSHGLEGLLGVGAAGDGGEE
jgi:hypothetical protein